MRQLPLIMIYSRLVMGIVIIAMAIFQFRGSKYFVIGLIAFGLISDILDGIIARRLGVSSEKLRRLDSGIDQVFWLSVILATYIMYPRFFSQHLYAIFLLLASEAICYLVSFVRFRKEVATHAISSKVWTLTLFATLIQLIATGNSTWLFWGCVSLGVITRVEIIIILLVIRKWTSDVPSLYHAVLIRNGKPIKRNKYFNG